MNIKQAEFITSQTTYLKCPPPDKPEYAFIGRSNVGKSSLINMLAARKGLAKTSASPGKTRLINHFLMNENWYLVDLPGYGFAKVSKSSRAEWDKMIRDYLEKRENLMYVFVLIDIRLEPQALDLRFIQWLGEKGIPLVLIFTKSDKISKQQIIYSVEQFKRELKKTWEELPVMFISSAEKKTGREEILDFIQQVNEEFKKQK
ncbi:MAG: YihA family ribosome biogenesis GTP-binding protein [Bacteroidetes bacterium]|nr:MAG: YihA family ribosome biogenesis GTP-binding protein [Bacteroidota bacterium]REK03481.1 MAG: YihA family ribosome biogenesis GTP-binding protein [Bacteroidota bacterium]REK34786.1 MAG: YihA family ribosome biogenesis GTP-binding protein [Bacteroidota bacterium]REK51335.1 MAG: YihA family ribosome biogenesis GTP-binding protein [Bacteroidota bacterium]